MCHSGCFEAGRFTQTQSSWTDLPTRSRKWMSGPAGSAQITARDTWTQVITGRQRQIVALLVRSNPALRKTHRQVQGEVSFSLTVSIPANIAEGFRRRGKPDKARFMNIAEGSVEECRYFLILAKDLGYGDTENLAASLEEVSRLSNAYTTAILTSGS